MKHVLVAVAVLLACGAPEDEELEVTSHAAQADGSLPICPPDANDVGYVCEIGGCTGCHGGDPYYQPIHCYECQPCKHPGHNKCKPPKAPKERGHASFRAP